MANLSIIYGLFVFHHDVFSVSLHRGWGGGGGIQEFSIWRGGDAIEKVFWAQEFYLFFLKFDAK